jgi:DeoR/GlpR family transcriptional regulator of sugar metabolism
VPKVSQSLIDERRAEITALLRDRSYLPIAELCRKFHISEATARRDLVALSKDKRVVRTFGGAMADFDRRFAPFSDRLKVAAAAKGKIAAAALNLIRPGATVFLDAGTTLYAIAGALRRRSQKPTPDPVHVVTNSFAVAEALSAAQGITVDILGGRMLPNQSVLLGPETSRAAGFFKFDVALLSAQGFDSTGIWNTEEDVVDLQRAVLSRSTHHAFCLDRRKLGKVAPALLMSWEKVDLLITDCDADDLQSAGIVLESEHLNSV